MGYPELLRVLGDEAAREAREVRASAERERARIVADARAAADASRASLLLRERGEAEVRRRAALDALALERDRALLGERRRLLDELRAEIAARLAGAGGAELDAWLLAELLPEIGEEPFDVVVDPGAEEGARTTLERLDPRAAARARIVAAAAARGGVEVQVGRRILDDTLASRLERAWPALEAELSALLDES